MADNKCWMIDNLKYRGEGGTPIEFNNTNGKYNTKNGNSTTGDNYDIRKYNNPASVSSCFMSATSYMPDGTLTGCGYLYNWYAATNGTGTYAMTSGEATGNICPTPNFKLPTSAQFTTLYNQIATAGFQRTGAWQGLYSGRWGSVLETQGTIGYGRSSTAHDASSAYDLDFTENIARPTDYSIKYYGFAVRCVL
jgi:uncharacterized protein (TIGR02145 family)